MDNEPVKKKTPPVKIGDIISVTVSGMAAKDPYVDYDGFIIFLRHATKNMVGKTYTVRITGVKERFGFAEQEDQA